MKTISDNDLKLQSTARPVNLQTFSAPLKDGRVITIREMTGKDLLYIEEELADLGDTRKNFKIMEILNVGDTHITFEEIESLSIKDIKTITDLVSRANGLDDEEEDEGGK